MSERKSSVDAKHENPFHGVVRKMNERRKKIAGRRHAEIQRMEAAVRFQSFVEQLPGMPYIVSLDKDDCPIYVSPKIEALLGFTPEQWCNDPQLRIRQVHPEDRAKVLQAITKAIEDNGTFNIDYRIFGRDGSLHWFHDEAQIMTDEGGKPLFLQGAALDITERKLAQLELERSHSELQELIGALDAVRIEEQKRLAHEMHDDFGQLLAAMKMDLSTLRQCLPQGDAQAVKYLSSINQLVDTMVTSVRRIIADLPPKILEDLGLHTALESMVRNIESRYRISCRLQLPDQEPELDTRIATAIYRMVQESLNNVVKHAHAEHAEVKIEYGAEDMLVSICDDGTGMSMEKMHKTGSFGLIGMRERVIALNGKMQIESNEGAGTMIRIVLPLNISAIPRQDCWENESGLRNPPKSQL